MGEPRGRVALLLGCVQRVFFGEVHRATIAVLAAEGLEVLAPRCPTAAAHSSCTPARSARRCAAAQQTVEAFAALGPLDHIVVNAAGCGAAMKDYGELLGTAPRT